MATLKHICRSCVLMAAFTAGAALHGHAAETEKDYWGAIAYAFDTGGHGYSTNYPTEEGAKQRALNECQKFGSDCNAWAWRNGCLAVALGFRSPDPPQDQLPNGVEIKLHDKKDAAEAESLKGCSKFYNDCYILRSVCTPQ